MTPKTALQLSEILDGFAEKINDRYNKQLSRITKFGDARDKYRGKIGAVGMITLLSKTDQKRLRATWKRYLIVSDSEDLEIIALLERYRKIAGGN